ncbi:MAG: type I-B CRISPR-associated protein Cas7/Csh2 [Candidatus Lokiarchaeota archaeon]|nr:type I-B CRISPR-associated protein Cas7/Csh2 [Candidatus Lokiarchaeota archaeon]
MSKNLISNRSEILFFFEVNNNNPNGDPNFENRPRVDESDGKCLISPYRIKRTIRDYLRLYEKESILITDFETLPIEFFENNEINDIEIKSIEKKEDLADLIFKNFIDARLFGLALPYKDKKESLEYYGPVQFSYAKTLHSVELYKNQGTAAFASGSGKRNRSFRSEYIIPYGFFLLYGVINENCGYNTHLLEEDCIKLERALWNGTNFLASRSKIGHKSKLLIRIIYKKPSFQINLMNELFSLNTRKCDEEIRTMNHFVLDIDQFLEILNKYRDSILKIRIIEDSIRLNNYNNICSALEKTDLDYKIIEV